MKHAAFSLLEILIVISIIAVIAGLALFAGRSMLGQGDIEQTRAAVHAAAGIITEYQAKTDRIPQYTGTYADDADVNDKTAYANSIEELLLAVRGSADELIQGISADARGNRDDDQTPAGEDRQEIVDAWDNPLRYSRFEPAAGGAVAYYGDYAEGMPHKRTPYVAAAGPDGLWGEYVAPVPPSREWTPDADAEDNIYSFDQQ